MSNRNGGGMGFSVVTYNIQYGFGMDGRYDLDRIVAAIRDADVIALQEVTRRMPNNNMVDMVAEITERLPGHFHVYGAPFGIDLGSSVENGQAVNRHFQFGNMLLSRTPIRATRTLLLPRTATDDVLNFQRCALEAVVDTPAGPVRFYCVHLDHVSVEERLEQIAYLKSLAQHHGHLGGAATGLSTFGFPEVPRPDHALLLGDFNLEPESAEYVALCGTASDEYGRSRGTRNFVDVTRPEGSAIAETLTWFDPQGAKRPKRIDYVFTTASLAPHCRDPRVDETDAGSDHRPVWIDIAADT